MAMWAQVATPEQARQMVQIHFCDTTSFNAPAGIRTLSPLEKCIMCERVVIPLHGQDLYGLM